MKNITIKSLSDKAETRINEIQENTNKTYSQIMDMLIEAYDNGQLLQLDDKTKELLKQASDITGISQSTIISKGTRFEAKKLITNSGKLKTANIGEKTANMRFSGVARERINNFVQAQIETNLKQPETARKITQSFIFKGTGCNMKAIKEYLSENKARLEEHYKEIDLDIS